jgi:glycosyltransferase involved in cell wall biosynthesis
MKRVLEVNVDDVGMGGVYSLVRNVIIHTPDIKFDIACIIPFENQSHIDELKSYGCNVYCIGNGAKIWNRWNTYYKNTKKLLEEHQYDCVHIHSDVAYLLYYFSKAAKDAGVKKIIIHSHAAGIDGNHRRLKMAFHKAYRNRLKSTANVFLSCSDLASEWMFPNIGKENVTIIKNGIDLNRFKYNSEKRVAERERLGLIDNFVVGNVGRFAYQKNHKFIIDTFDLVHKKINNSKLLLIGEGELGSQYRKYCEELGLTDDVIFYGTSSNVENLLQAMDVFVLPSFFEGLPIVGIEAQAASLPTIMSDQITRMAVVTDDTIQLPITSGTEKIWAEKIIELTQNNRSSSQRELIANHFDIADTVNDIKQIYV